MLEGRLLVPAFDRAVSPDISAEDQIADAVGQAVQDSARYVRRVVQNPRLLESDILAAGRQTRAALDPSATPVAPTTAEELQRRFAIGMNQGELTFDIGSAIVGGPEAKALGRAAEGLSIRPASIEKYTAQRFDEATAAHLAEPYDGMGHHYIPLRMKPPPPFRDSAFNVMKPERISRGDFYKLHYKLHPKLRGFRLPDGMNNGFWDGAALGIPKHGALGRMWYGAPGPLKARVGGLTAAGGAAAYTPADEHER